MMAGWNKYITMPCLFLDLCRKNEPHIGVLEAFEDAGWDKICGKKQLDLTGFTSQ